MCTFRANLGRFSLSGALCHHHSSVSAGTTSPCTLSLPSAGRPVRWSLASRPAEMLARLEWARHLTILKRAPGAPESFRCLRGIFIAMVRVWYSRRSASFRSVSSFSRAGGRRRLCIGLAKRDVGPCACFCVGARVTLISRRPGRSHRQGPVRFCLPPASTHGASVRAPKLHRRAPQRCFRGCSPCRPRCLGWRLGGDQQHHAGARRSPLPQRGGGHRGVQR